MDRVIIKIGQRFSHWLILAEAGKAKDRHRLFLCSCDCGRRVIIQSNNLKAGKSTRCKSCQARKKNTTHGASIEDPLYGIWQTMIQRYTNPRREKYRYYGERGIKVCERWRKSFGAFRSDLSPRPSPKYTLDRIDNDGDYKPGNIRWATAKEQAQTRRRPKHWRPKVKEID